MSKQYSDYTLFLRELPVGNHRFEFDLNHDFFAQAEGREVLDGYVKVVIFTIKRADSVALQLVYKGTVDVACDRCLHPVSIPIDTEEALTVKFGATYSEQNDDVIVIPEAEGTLDMAWLFYECIVLTLPTQRIHADGACNTEMMTCYNRYVVNSSANRNENKADPRWEALRNMNNNLK
ncbi:MAG: DUF177 domain-containing protein [Prevotellaceae bacterium]|nr:DUF177 domain-containing protein [Prevotellaceae bacterium]